MPSQVAGKYSIFKDNLNLIMQHNAEHAEGKHRYKLAVNRFADMTRAEFSRTMLGLNAPNKKETKVDETLLESSSTPSSIDWVEKGAVTPVKNQGSCGGEHPYSTTLTAHPSTTP